MTEVNRDITRVGGDAEKLLFSPHAASPTIKDYPPEFLDVHCNQKLRFAISVERAITHWAVIFIAVNAPCSSEDSQSYRIWICDQDHCAFREQTQGHYGRCTVPVYTSEWIRRTILLDAHNSSEFRRELKS